LTGTNYWPKRHQLSTSKISEIACGYGEVSCSQTLYPTATRGKGLVTLNPSTCLNRKYAGDV